MSKFHPLTGCHSGRHLVLEGRTRRGNLSGGGNDGERGRRERGKRWHTRGEEISCIAKREPLLFKRGGPTSRMLALCCLVEGVTAGMLFDDFELRRDRSLHPLCRGQPSTPSGCRRVLSSGLGQHWRGRGMSGAGWKSLTARRKMSILRQR